MAINVQTSTQYQGLIEEVVSQGDGIYTIPVATTEPADPTSISAYGTDFTLAYTYGLPRITATTNYYSGATMFMATGGADGTYAAAQVKSTPLATTIGARAVGVAGDGILVSPGTYTANGAGAYGANTYHRPVNLKGLTYIADGSGEVILKATSTSYVVFIDSTLETAMTTILKDITIDANAVSAACVANGTISAKTWDIQYLNCKFKNSTNRGVLLSPLTAGSFTFDGCEFTGDSTTGGFIVTTGTVGGSGVVTLNLKNSTMNALMTGNCQGFVSITSALQTNAPVVTIDNNTINLQTTAANQFLSGVTTTLLGVTASNNTITITSPDTYTSLATGIWIYSSAYTPVTDALITGNTIYNNAALSYGLALGTTTTDETTGTIEKNTVYGKYYASATPHGIAGRKASKATIRYNKIVNEYVGILANTTTTASITENVTVDCYGADLYAKACTAATFDKNTCIITATAKTRRNLGVISVDSQTSVNTTATTMSNNVVLLGQTSINKLSNIAVNQSCTYTGNTYIVPDTFNESDVLFYVGSAEGGAGGTGYTIAEWMTGTAGSIPTANGTGTIAVSGEKVIQMPLAAILEMIATLV